MSGSIDTTNPFNNLHTADTSKISLTDSSANSKTKKNELDENAFVKILTAEMANQSPDNTQDATQFISQMAQFASVEQMLNLNNTMTFNGASSLAGKVVTMNSQDSAGNPYTGVVQNVTKDGDNIELYIALLDKDGKQIFNKDADKSGKHEADIEKFDYSSVSSVSGNYTGNILNTQEDKDSSNTANKDNTANTTSSSASKSTT